MDDGDNGFPVIYCHACGGNFIEWLREHGLQRTNGTTTWTKADQRLARRNAREREEERVEQARAVVYVAKRTRKQPTAYLQARGIKDVPADAYLLLPHKRRWDFLPHSFRQFPSMVLPIIKLGKGVVGAHITALNRCGDGKLHRQEDDPRRTPGDIQGGYVPLVPSEAEKPLIIAEGVETGLSASQLAGGLPAISAISTSGMKALEAIPECSEVIIARDRGKPGRLAAEGLAARLARTRPVRIVVPPGGDWNDVLQDREVDARKVWQRALVKAKRVEPEHRHWLTMEELRCLDLPPMKNIVDPILVMPGMTMVHARAGAGKTRLLLSLGYAKTTGKKLMDWTPNEPGRVMFVDAELPVEVMDAWWKRLGPKTPNYVLINDMYNYRMGYPQVTLATEEGRAYLMDQIEAFDPELVVLDSLFTLVPPGMADGRVSEDKWSHVVAFLRELKRAGRHVILSHHDGKGGSQYGQSVKEIEFDLMMQIKVRDDLSDMGKRAFALSFTKQRHLSIEAAQPRIITATEEGRIVWEREADVKRSKGKIGDKRTEVEKLLQEGKMTQTGIAKMFGVDKSRVTQIKQEMEERGLSV